MKRLSEFVPPDAYVGYEPLDTVKGIPLTIHSVTFYNGTYGEYAVMSVTTTEGETKKLISGASMVVPALRKAVEAGALPVVATFEKRGRKWIIV